MIDTRVTIRAGSGAKQIDVADYLEPAAEEAAHEAYRHADGRWHED